MSKPCIAKALCIHNLVSHDSNEHTTDKPKSDCSIVWKWCYTNISCFSGRQKMYTSDTGCELNNRRFCNMRASRAWDVDLWDCTTDFMSFLRLLFGCIQNECIFKRLETCKRKAKTSGIFLLVNFGIPSNDDQLLISFLDWKSIQLPLCWTQHQFSTLHIDLM